MRAAFAKLCVLTGSLGCMACSDSTDVSQKADDGPSMDAGGGPGGEGGAPSTGGVGGKVTGGAGGGPSGAGGATTGGAAMGGAGGTSVGGTAGASTAGAGGTPTVDPTLTRRDNVGSGTPEPGLTSTAKLDLLLVVDNSIGMKPLHDLFSASVATLLDRVTSMGVDLHVGVVSSSLESPGSICRGREGTEDNAHLVGTLPRGSHLGLSEGFSSWVPGEDAGALTTSVRDMIDAVGDTGCGFETTQEAWYRFLVDPTPPAGFAETDCSSASSVKCAGPTGIDQDILDQRAAFLRPDSAVAVIVVSDENDCSYQPTGQLYYVTRLIDLPKASAVCTTNPNDPCCYSCALNPPSGCAPDPTCTDELGRVATVPPDDDSINLRCALHESRFGIDFLYPVERYVAGLTAATLPAYGDPAAGNPLYAGGAAGRDPSLVFMLGIVGTPWQDLASSVDASGAPLGAGELRFRSASELVDDATWSVILGDPEASPPVRPTDALMIESIDPRSGTDGTGTGLAGPAAGFFANAINGHEFLNADRDVLQHTCLFPLATAVDCGSAPLDEPCLCRELTSHPACQEADGSYSTMQRFRMAYPGLRHLEVLQELGDQAVLGSVCARNVTEPTSADYALRPALDSLWERLDTVLVP